MYSPLEIAAYFIVKSVSERRYLTPIQIMKLCYFAHGYKLAIDDKPLVDETVQAWKYGPVFKDLYHTLKLYGNKRITNLPATMEYDSYLYEEGDLEILDAVYESLSDMDGMSLSDLTHEEGTPWSRVWNDVGQKKNFTPINDDIIKEYFKGILENE